MESILGKKRTLPSQLSSPPSSVQMSGVFHADDVALLAERAGVKVHKDANRDALAAQMTSTLLDAHYTSEHKKGLPTPGATREAFRIVAAKGRELLLALGLSNDLAKIAVLDYPGVAKASGILNAMLRFDLPASLSPLPERVIAAHSLPRDPDDERQKLAAQRYLMDSARALAFLVAFAEAAQPVGGRSGPAPDWFTPSLFYGLARLYRDTFGAWPKVSKNVVGEYTGHSLKWVEAFIVLAIERLRSPTTLAVRIDELLSSLNGILDTQSATRGRYFEEAAANAKRGKSSPTS
jgi:hypothetical protein